MSKLTDILQQPEGSRLEFKSALPTNPELAKSIVSFANDAGGEY
jgi:predicted HTH transcriptional regulator